MAKFIFSFLCPQGMLSSPVRGDTSFRLFYLEQNSAKISLYNSTICRMVLT